MLHNTEEDSIQSLDLAISYDWLESTSIQGWTNKSIGTPEMVSEALEWDPDTEHL